MQKKGYISETIGSGQAQHSHLGIDIRTAGGNNVFKFINK